MFTPEQKQKQDNVRTFLKERVSDGKIFAVDFVKRTTGEDRHMVCRLGVRKHLKGGEQGYDPVEKGLLTVYDIQKAGYRSIPLDAVTQIKLQGEIFTE